MSAVAERNRPALAGAGAKIATEAGARLVAELTPMLEARLAELVSLPPPRSSPKGDALLMEACRKVGQACDRIDAVRYTAAEKAARRTLEKAARHLAAVMRARGPR